MPNMAYLKNLRVLSYIFVIISMAVYFWLEAKPSSSPHCAGMACMANGIAQVAEFVIFVLPALIVACVLNVVSYVKARPNVSIFRKVELGLFVVPVAVIVYFILRFFG